MLGPGSLARLLTVMPSPLCFHSCEKRVGTCEGDACGVGRWNCDSVFIILCDHVSLSRNLRKNQDVMSQYRPNCGCVTAAEGMAGMRGGPRLPLLEEASDRHHALRHE